MLLIIISFLLQHLFLCHHHPHHLQNKNTLSIYVRLTLKNQMAIGLTPYAHFHKQTVTALVSRTTNDDDDGERLHVSVATPKMAGISHDNQRGKQKPTLLSVIRPSQPLSTCSTHALARSLLQPRSRLRRRRY